ncbi:MAG TPA: hypothetical protein VF808_10030 [Ktedonobacterales bacterium]
MQYLGAIRYERVTERPGERNGGPDRATSGVRCEHAPGASRKVTLLSQTLEQYEAIVRAGIYPEPYVTPTSAIVGIDVNSMAGSGVRAFGDFGEATCWFWRVCEDHYDPKAHGAAWTADEHAPPELLETRRRFRTLLTRFVRDGYAPDMGQELHDIVFDALGGGWAVAGYEVSGVSIFPDALDKQLDGWWGDPEEDEYFATLAAEGKPVPPFDFSNPEHMEALERRMEQRMRDG